jgi:hypothetical protein
MSVTCRNLVYDWLFSMVLVDSAYEHEFVLESLAL